MTESLNTTALRDMLDALSTTRTKRFCSMAEDELLNLYRHHRQTEGTIRKVTFPPLSENLRDLISMVASRFAMKVTVLPEGDQEKQTMVEFHRNTVFPTLLISDLFPKWCSLLSSQHRVAPTSEKEETPASIQPRPTQKEKHSGSPDGKDVSRSKDESPTKRARPALGVYRPPGASRGKQASEDEQMVQGRSPPLRSSESGILGQDPANDAAPARREELAEPDEEECSLLHDYQQFRLDLTTVRAWDEMPRKRAYVELNNKGSAGGAKFARDGSWQLKRSGNGSVSFTVQAQSRDKATVQVALREEGSRTERMVLAEVDPISRHCSIALVDGGSELSRVEGTGVAEPRRGQGTGSLPARPQPESFWVAVRGHVAAVGCGSKVTSASAVAVLRAEAPLDAVRDIGFAHVGAPLSVARIAVGKPLCPVLASVGHVLTLHAPGALAEAVVCAPSLPRCVRAAWAALPSVASWSAGAAGLPRPRRSYAHPVLERLEEAWPGVRVVARDADSGWAIFASEHDAAAALQHSEEAARDDAGDSLMRREDAAEADATPAARAVLGRCGAASRELLAAAGLPLARERRAVAGGSASRLIAQALRQSRPSSARPTR